MVRLFFMVIQEGSENLPILLDLKIIIIFFNVGVHYSRHNKNYTQMTRTINLIWYWTVIKRLIKIWLPVTGGCHQTNDFQTLFRGTQVRCSYLLNVPRKYA